MLIFHFRFQGSEVAVKVEQGKIDVTSLSEGTHYIIKLFESLPVTDNRGSTECPCNFSFEKHDLKDENLKKYTREMNVGDLQKVIEFLKQDYFIKTNVTRRTFYGDGLLSWEYLTSALTSTHRGNSKENPGQADLPRDDNEHTHAERINSKMSDLAHNIAGPFFTNSLSTIKSIGSKSLYDTPESSLMAM